MNILVIEDNDLKFNLVEACLREISDTMRTQRAASYQSGIETLVRVAFDCVILDMTLPVFDIDHAMVGMNVLTFGGEFILRDVKRRKISAKFIVLSQYDTFVRGAKEVTFDELRVELLRRYGDTVLGCVQLDSSSVNWKAELKILISPL